MSLRVTIDGTAAKHGGVSYTSADPGGCETAQITLADDTPPRPGAKVIITDGIAPVWIGEVEEPGFRAEGRRSVGCVGAKVELTRRRMAMVYASRDLSQWQGMSTARLIAYGANITPLTGPEGVMDTSGQPALKLSISGNISGSSGGRGEGLFDAGEYCRIARVISQEITLSNVNTGDANWALDLYSSTDDSVATYAAERAIISGGSFSAFSHRLKTSGVSRCAVIVLAYNGTYIADDFDRHALLINPSVIGDHGLQLRRQPGLFFDDALYASDIVRDAVRRAGFAATHRINDCSLLITDLMYRELVPHQQPIDDVLRLNGWHFGVWAPDSALSNRPVVVFSAPPQTATVFVRYGDLDNPDLTERRSSMFTTANITYSIPGGKGGSVQVTRRHPRLSAEDDATIDIDAGIVGSRDVAETYGYYMLALSQAQSRMSGSVTLPPYVKTGDGYKPSHHLRPGIDRLLIRDIPADTPLLASPPQRVDSFRIARLSVDEHEGAIHTTVELDQGADLIEVLQARFAKADPTGVLAAG